MDKNKKTDNIILKSILFKKNFKGEKQQLLQKKNNKDNIISRTINKYRKMKLRSQLIALFLILSIMPSVVINLYTNSQMADTMQNSLGISTQKMIEQAVYNLDGSTNAIIPSINKISIDMDFKNFTINNDKLGVDERLILKNKIDNVIFTAFTLNKNMEGIITVGHNKLLYSLASGTNKLKEGLSNGKILEDYFASDDFKNSDTFKKIAETSSSRAIWFFADAGETQRICIARKMNDTKDINEAVVSIFYISYDYYEAVLGKATIDSRIPILLVDDLNQVVFSNNPELISTTLSKRQITLLGKARQIGEQSGTIPSENAVVSYGQCINGWTLIMDAPMKVLMEDMRRTTSQVSVMLILLVLLVIVISILISQKIASPIKMMAGYMGEIEAGNLNVEKDIRGKIKVSNAESHLLVNGFMSMIATIRTLIDDAKEVTAAVEQNTSALEEVAVNTAQSAHDIEIAVDNIAQGAQMQNEQIEKSMIVMEDLSKAINEVMMSVDNIQEVSKITTDMSTNTMTKLEGLVTQSQDTVTISHNVSAQVKDLGEEASNIGNILNLIKGINNQTNLLSLNAAIEAARAGEAGKGFAVVADEVRKLSYQTQEAILAIETTINKIHTKKEDTIKSLQKAIDVFDKQVPIVKETNETFTNIYSQMQSINNKIDQVTVVLTTVAQQKNDVTNRMNDIAQIIEQAASVTEEVSAETVEQSQYSAEMTKMAKKLSETVDELKKAYHKFN